MKGLLLDMLAQAGTAAGAGGGADSAYRYTHPFVQPLPVWDHWVWLLIPLTVGIAVVYKAVKCSKVGEVPRAAAVMALWILLAFSLAAAGLSAFVRVMQ